MTTIPATFSRCVTQLVLDEKNNRRDVCCIVTIILDNTDIACHRFLQIEDCECTLHSAHSRQLFES